MKKLFLALLILPVSLCAQKVKWENDTIFKDGKPYALLVKSGGLDFTFSLRTLSGLEIAVAKNDPGVPKNANGASYYRVTFPGSGQIAHFLAAAPIGKRLAKAFVENDVVGETGVNPEGEKRFIALNPSQVPQQVNVTVNVNNADVYKTAERNRQSPVFEAAGTIRQDNVVIGTCTSVTSSDRGKNIVTVTFMLPNGTKCAVATFEGITEKTCTIVTMKDNRTHSFTVKNSAMKEKEVAEFLVQNYYL